MGKFIGRQISCGLAKEAVRGTKVNPSFWLPVDVDLDDAFDHIINDEGLGRIEEASDMEIIKKWAEGDLSGKVRDKSFGLVLLATMGSVASAVKSGETLVYEHTFSVNQSIQHQSLTVEVKNPNEQLAFANAVVDGLNIKVELGAYVDFTANILAKLGVSASNTPAIVAENKFLAKGVSVKFADNITGLSGASAIKAKNVNLKINKNVESDDVLGSVEPDDFNNKQFSVEGSMELNFSDTTYKALALAGTQKSMRIEIENSGVTIGSSSHPKIVIDLYKVFLTEWDKSGGLGDIVKQTLNFKAFYDVSNSKMISVVLTNLSASY